MFSSHPPPLKADLYWTTRADCSIFRSCKSQLLDTVITVEGMTATFIPEISGHYPSGVWCCFLFRKSQFTSPSLTFSLKRVLCSLECLGQRKQFPFCKVAQTGKGRVASEHCLMGPQLSAPCRSLRCPLRTTCFVTSR